MGYFSIINSLKNSNSSSNSNMEHIAFDRRFLPLWCLRIVQFIFALSVLGVAGSDASDFHSLKCHTPGKIGFHIAVGVLTMLTLLYFLFSTGPKPIPRFLPWHMWTQLGLDAFFFILWIAAAGCSTLTLKDLEDACPWWNNPDELLAGTIFKRGGFTPLTKRKDHSSSGGSHSTHVSAGTRQGLDAMMVIFFAASLAYTSYYVYLQRKASASTIDHTHNPAIGAGATAYYESQPVVEEQKYNNHEPVIREVRTPSPQPPRQAEQVRLHPGYAGQAQQHPGYSGYDGNGYYAERR